VPSKPNSIGKKPRNWCENSSGIDRPLRLRFPFDRALRRLDQMLDGDRPSSRNQYLHPRICSRCSLVSVPSISLRAANMLSNICFRSWAILS
jgi:hypothetical protein